MIRGLHHSAYRCRDSEQTRAFYDGYVIELTAKTPTHDREMDPAVNGAREKLDRWTAARQHRTTVVS